MESNDKPQPRAKKPSLLRQVWDTAGITPEVEAWQYQGTGTQEDPYLVTWIPEDPRNPMLYSDATKWFLTAIVGIATLAVTFVSSGYSGGAREIMAEFNVSQELYILGLSVFVLGFAIGPLFWAPLSEMFGRQVLFASTYAAFTAFNAATAGAQSIEALIILRFIAGAFGSSPLTNAGGVIADTFTPGKRGLAMALFAAAPSLGPALGPIVGGFVSDALGWRWLEGIMAIFTGVVWIVGMIFVPETYAPVLLRSRARKLSEKTGKVYMSSADAKQARKTFGSVFGTAFSRPWKLLFREPIVFLLSIYMAVIFGTLYLLIGAFPFVYQQQRGWSSGIGGLSFLGVAFGLLAGVAFAIWDNKRYSKISALHRGFAPAEARLPMCMIGGVSVPVGLFWFAWTTFPSLHWIISIIGTVPFGFGMCLTLLSTLNYLVDSYTIYAASALAANSILRSLFGAAFPLFTGKMYEHLGAQWASSIPAFLALACVPFPFIFYKFGPAIREKSKYAAESSAFMKQMQVASQASA